MTRCAVSRLLMPGLLFLSGIVQAQQNTDDPPAVVQHTSTAGFYYSRGEYGEEENTRIRYLPLSHELKVNDWRFKATASWLEIAGPSAVLINVGNAGIELVDRSKVRGRGDTILSVAYEVPSFSTVLPFFDLGFEVKLPTADERQALGTGKVDAGAQLDAFQVYGGNTVFASLGWKWRQSAPQFEQLRHSWTASIGLARPVTDALQIGLIYDYRGAVSAVTGETHELLPYLSWSLASDISVMIYIVRGFTSDSADRAGGLQLTYRW